MLKYNIELSNKMLNLVRQEFAPAATIHYADDYCVWIDIPVNMEYSTSVGSFMDWLHKELIKKFLKPDSMIFMNGDVVRARFGLTVL